MSAQNASATATLTDVVAAYSGPEADLWELLMGQQIHVGGFASSCDLAERAGIQAGWRGVDLCACTGAGCRFLVRYRQVAAMTGVDATARMVARGRERNAAEGLADRIRLVEADACATGLPAASCDVVWGEDAWCYVTDKPALVREAARLVKPGGIIAFTDWVAGPVAMSPAESRRLLTFMKFPGIESLDGYPRLLRAAGCTVRTAADTGRFPACIDLYLAMVTQQLTGDALRLLGHDQAVLQAIGGEMQALRELVHARKLVQGAFVAVKDNA